MFQKIHSFGALAVLSLLGVTAAGCGDVDPASEGSEQVRAVQSEILDGWDMNDDAVRLWGLVAVYHPAESGATWFGRPCGGVILRSEGGVSAVMTARHCVTMNGRVDGTIAPPDRIRLAPSAHPGPANPNPPQGAVTPSSIVGMPIQSVGTQQDRDVAIIFANVDWFDRVSGYPFGIWLGEPEALTGRPFAARGYGINVNDQNCDLNGTTQGAGHARVGLDFFINSAKRVGLAGSYTYLNGSTNNQAVMCGDSGGPDHANLGPGEFVWTHILGVHSTGKVLNASIQSTVPGMFVQNTIGGTYLSPDFNRNMNAGLGTVSFVGPIWRLYNENDAAVARVFYDPATQMLSGGGTCMEFAWPSVRARPCNAAEPRQRWFMTPNRWLQHVQTGQCLTVSTNGTGLSVQDCSFANLDIMLRQHWAFHAQR